MDFTSLSATEEKIIQKNIQQKPSKDNIKEQQNYME